jgi:hypothetical protein
MDASAYALAHGIRSTRGALHGWKDRPWPVVRTWLVGSLLAGSLLLVAIWIIAEVSPARGTLSLHRPPFGVGGSSDAVRIFASNLLVLALHAMACVAGFIAGDSLPLQARYYSGRRRAAYIQGRRITIAFVVAATAFSLSLQSYRLGVTVAHVAGALHSSPAMLLLGLLPHALPELTALFLPLAAWIVASRRGEWDQLLAAAMVTVAIAIPILIVTATWEVYVAPHILSALFGY